MFKKSCIVFVLVLSFLLANAFVSSAGASWSNAYLINDLDTFVDAGPDARGLRPGTFGCEYPRLTKLSDGSWLCVLTIYDNNGYIHTSSWGGTRLQVFKSTDNCRSWTLISTIADNNRDLDNGQIIQLPNGELRMAARSVRWQESYTILIYRSTDGGRNWSYISTMDENHGAPGELGNPDKGIYEPHFILLDDGALACFYANEKHVTENPSYSQIISEKISYDGGYTWSSEIWVAWNPSNSRSRPGMPVITKMANGRYIVVFEVVGPEGGKIYYKTSNDGKTWSSGIGNVIPHQQQAPYITSLSDGRLVVTSCNQNISVSSDFGATWVLDSNPWNFGLDQNNLCWNSVYQIGPDEIVSVVSAPRAVGGHNCQIKFAPMSSLTQGVLGQIARFESNNYGGHFIRHYEARARIDSNISPFEDSQWRIVPGLADSNAVSFESVNYPGRYLRHRDGEIWNDPYDGTALFNADATWWIRPGLADSNGISFESYNYPGEYIRHSNWLLWRTPINTTLDRADATFYKR